jgi:hypothetical protein
MTPEEITARCDEFTPDSLKALSLWMTRNNEKEHGKPLTRETAAPVVETQDVETADVNDEEKNQGPSV